MLQFPQDKTSIVNQLRELIHQSLRYCFKERGLKIGFEEIILEHPENPEHGDFSSNIAMTVFSRIQKKHLRGGGIAAIGGKGHLGGGKGVKSPLELAKLIAKNIPKVDYLESVEVAGKGFINFWLSKKWLVDQLGEALEEKEKYGQKDVLKGKKILLEHTSPDPIKTLHIGHLRNNFLGMSVYRILKFLGAQVTLDCINNDRGTHVSQAILGYLAFAERDKVKKEDLRDFSLSDKAIKEVVAKFNWQEALGEWVKKPGEWLKPEDLGLKPDHFDLRVYAVAAKAIKLVPELKDQVAKILKAWEAEEKKVWQLWRQIIDWSLEGYEKTYQRIGSHHDHFWHESDLYKEGKEMVYQGLKKGIFKKSQGAIVTDLSKYNLPDTVMIKSDGTALYITFDINLTRQKKTKFPSDLYIWDIGNDQQLYMQQMFAVCEQLGIGMREELFHLNYGYVYLKGGEKMSSRQGTIISGDELLDLLVKKATEMREESAKGKIRGESDFDEAVGLGALKYSLLKNNRSSDMYFDIDESINLQGDSGPYLQYTYARCQSVLRKASQGSKTIPDRRHIPIRDRINNEELVILRTLYKFSEVVAKAGRAYAPNLLCSYLYDLAGKFNTFYNRHRILQPTEDPENPDVSSGHGAGTSEVKSADTSEVEEFRLALTASVGQILKNGLNLLGIKALEQM